MTMVSGCRRARLGELVAFKTGKLDSNAAVPNGEYPFFTCSQETLRTNTYSFDTECVLLAGNNANGIFPLKYFNGKFDAYQRTYVVTTRDPQVLTARFLYYALRPKLSQFRSVSTGAATKFLTLTILNETEIEVPPLPAQRRIAGILSAYDDLIENNQQHIKILEKMARSLYREWFVHFRFPGHEKVKMVPSSLGPVPQGWEVKNVKQVLARRPAGQVYREEDVVLEGTVPVIDQSTNELLGFHDNEPDQLATPANPIAIFGDHTCKMQLLVEPFSIGPNVVAFETNIDRPISYLFHIVRSLVQTQEYKRHWSQLTASEIVLADKSTTEHFATLIQPSLQQIEVLRKASRVLRRTRDLLLPRLLSGAIKLTSEGISATQEIA